MTDSGWKIVRDHPDGGLLLQAAHSATARLRRLDAVLQPDGLWLIPAHRRGEVEMAVRPPRRSLAPPRTEKTKAGPTPEEVDLWFQSLPTVDGLTVQRYTRLHLGFRLTRHSSEALTLLKGIPGRVWVPNHGTWELKITSALQMTAIRSVIEQLTEVMKAAPRRQKAPVEAIFAIEDAPDLERAFKLDGNWVVFETTSQMFRLHEGHGRQIERLRPHVGKYACNFKGRFARADEITSDPEEESAAPTRGTVSP